MKIITKIKFVCYLVVGLLCLCGVFFIRDFFTKKVEEKQCIKVEENVLEKGKTLRDLEACQAELFNTKNINEKLKIMPDSRKDIVKILLLMRDIEKRIGFDKDFSNDCVNLFALAQRIPEVQEMVLQYKNKMFDKTCQVATNSEIVGLITPFQVKIIDKQFEQQNVDSKLWKRALKGVKYRISRLFVSSKLEQSEIEKQVLNRNYQEALTLLDKMQIDTGDNEKNAEYKKLYDALEGLYLLQSMVDNMYKIIVNVNDNK